MRLRIHTVVGGLFVLVALAVMLVLAYRSDEIHRRHPLFQFLAEVERTGRVEQIPLPPLNRHELGVMLRAIAGPEIDAHLVDTIHAR